jgi:hypothetical protein
MTRKMRTYTSVLGVRASSVVALVLSCVSRRIVGGATTRGSYQAVAPCPDRSLRARWRRGLVAVGLGRAFERIGGGLCRLSRIGGSERCQVVGGGFAGGR